MQPRFPEDFGGDASQNPTLASFEALANYCGLPPRLHRQVVGFYWGHRHAIQVLKAMHYNVDAKGFTRLVQNYFETEPPHKAQWKRTLRKVFVASPSLLRMGIRDERAARG